MDREAHPLMLQFCLKLDKVKTISWNSDYRGTVTVGRQGQCITDLAQTHINYDELPDE